MSGTCQGITSCFTPCATLPLSLQGVSHTNELDTGEAVTYLTRWGLGGRRCGNAEDIGGEAATYRPRWGGEGRGGRGGKGGRGGRDLPKQVWEEGGRGLGRKERGEGEAVTYLIR